MIQDTLKNTQTYLEQASREVFDLDEENKYLHEFLDSAVTALKVIPPHRLMILANFLDDIDQEHYNRTGEIRGEEMQRDLRKMADLSDKLLNSIAKKKV